MAVPAREEVVRAGERDCIDMSMCLPIVTEPDGLGEMNTLCSQAQRQPSRLLISVRAVLRLLQRWESRADLLLSHLCVLQDVDIDEESLFVLSHAPQQESSFF